MRRIFALLIGASLILALLCGCDDNSEAVSSLPTVDYPVTAFDKTISACPQRVVSLSPAVTDIIVELGSDAQLAGVSDFCRTDKELERCGTSLEPDIEGIKALSADLVFATTAITDDDKASIEALGAVVIDVRAAGDYTELLSLYKQVASAMSGGITGPRNASNTFDRLDAELKSIADKKKEKVSVAVYFSPTMLIPSGCLADDLIALAGGKNVAKAEGETDDAIRSKKPQIILCPPESVDSFKERFEGIRVEGFDMTLLESHGGKLADAVGQMNAIFAS